LRGRRRAAGAHGRRLFLTKLFDELLELLNASLELLLFGCIRKRAARRRSDDG
jgi:hypothetical protein